MIIFEIDGLCCYWVPCCSRTFRFLALAAALAVVITLTNSPCEYTQYVYPFAAWIEVALDVRHQLHGGTECQASTVHLAKGFVIIEWRSNVTYHNPAHRPLRLYQIVTLQLPNKSNSPSAVTHLEEFALSMSFQHRRHFLIICLCAIRSVQATVTPGVTVGDLECWAWRKPARLGVTYHRVTSE